MMNKLMYVERDEDQVILLKDEEMHFDTILKMVRELFGRGIKFVGFETNDVRVYFDNAKDAGNQAITGKFKDRKMVN